MYTVHVYVYYTLDSSIDSVAANILHRAISNAAWILSIYLLEGITGTKIIYMSVSV